MSLSLKRKFKENCGLGSCDQSEHLKCKIILSSMTTCTQVKELLAVPDKKSYAHFAKETSLGLTQYTPITAAIAQPN